MATSGHQSEDRLGLYALGRLAEYDLARIKEHLLLCDPCRDLLDRTADFAVAMRGELKKHPEPVHKPSFAWRPAFAWLPAGPAPRFAMAGAFAVALLALGIFSMRTDGVRPSLPLVQLTAVHLTATRGEMSTIQASRELVITITDAPANGAPFQMEVVDGNGLRIWAGTPLVIPEHSKFM